MTSFATHFDPITGALVGTVRVEHDHRPSKAPGPTSAADRPCTTDCRPVEIPNRPATYEEFCDEEAAVHYGHATRLVRCYLCEPDPSKRTLDGAGPLRGVLRTSTVEAHRDPTEALHLTCGHTII